MGGAYGGESGDDRGKIREDQGADDENGQRGWQGESEKASACLARVLE